MSDMSSTIRVAGREGLLSAIPVLLGFHPADSVVIACLGKNNRVAPVIRVDLAAYLSGPVVLADQLGRSMTQFADRGVLVFYGIEADPHDLVGKAARKGGPYREEGRCFSILALRWLIVQLSRFSHVRSPRNGPVPGCHRRCRAGRL